MKETLDFYRSQKRWGIFFTFMLYIVAFGIGYKTLGLLAAAFCLIPVVIAAWFLGWRTGFLTAIFSVLAIVIFLFVVDGSLTQMADISVITRIIILFAIALITGLLSDNKRQLEIELKDRKESERELVETDKWYRSIFDGVNDAVFVETVDGKVLDVNIRACEMFGWSHEEFLTKTVKDMVPPENRALLAENDAPLDQNEFETINMRANGEYFPVSVSGRLRQIGDEKRLIIIVRDITEKQRIESELKRQHQFLSHVIESLSHPFYVVNIDDYSIAISNSAARGNYALDEHTTCYAMTHQRDTPCGDGVGLPCPLQDVLKTRRAVRQEHIHYEEDGEERIFEINGYPIFNAQGKVIQMIESSLDITERKRSEENLQMLGRALEQAQDGMAIADVDGKIIFANNAWAEMHGCYAINDIIGKPLSAFHTAEQLQNDVMPFNEKVMEEGAAQGEIGHRRKDGSVFPTWMSVGTLKDPSGKTIGLVASAHDVSERKKTEEELFKLYRATNQSPVSIVITDLNGNIEYVNPAFSNVSGYTLEEVLGQNPRVLQSGVHTKAFYADLWNTIASGNIWRGEFCNKNRNGKVFWESASIAPISDTKGKVTHYVAVKEDITEKKRILVEMEEAKNVAEAAVQAKADFLANMSHEIRTPLNAIYGMTSLMLDTPLNEEQQDFIETIRGGSDTLLKVINDILDFSKIEAGKMDLEMQPFYLRGCVEDALDLLSEKAAGKLLNLAYMIEDGVPAVVVGDVTRLRQILVNLLNNALKFTDKGEVVINLDSCRVENNQHELHFSVRDTGIGIPQDKIDKLFKSFSQVDTSTTRKYGGTGLGLAISQQLAVNMGGTMWVESEESKGSTFHFTILVDAKDDVDPLVSRKDISELSGKRVLIVDDNATNRLILIKQTEAWDMQPLAVASGIEAIKLLNAGRIFDIAILDMQMPEMDGFTLAKKIGQTTSSVPPLIILTSIKRQKARASDARVSAFLNKPIKTANLFNVLMEIINLAPAQKREPKKLVHIDSETAARHPLRILLAEDNAINQKVALKLLSRLGYRADLAGNGIEVIEALERQTYDVIFMDIQMPEMDGNEATQLVRKKWTTDRQPYIIAMTAHALEGDREKYIARGMDDYVSKPIRVEALVSVLEKAVSLAACRR